MSMSMSNLGPQGRLARACKNNSIDYRECLRQCSRTLVRHACLFEMHAWNSSPESNMVSTTLKISVVHSKFGLPRRRTNCKGARERFGPKTNLRTGQASFLRANVPKKPSWCSSKIVLNFSAQACCKTSLLETLLQYECAMPKILRKQRALKASSLSLDAWFSHST